MGADGVKQGPGTGIVFLSGKMRLQIGILHLFQRAAGQKILQTLALQDPVVVIGYGQQDQNAVVLLGGADAPFVEHLGSVIADIHSLRGGNAGDNDLCAGHGEQGIVAGHDVIPRFRRDDAGGVQYVEYVGRIGNAGGIIPRRSAAGCERNQ